MQLNAPNRTVARDTSRRSLKIAEGLRITDVRIASTRQEFTSAYGLVYKAYVDRGFIDPHPSAVLYRLSYGLPGTRTFIAVNQNQQVVGTVTLVNDSALGLPLESVYDEEVDELRTQGVRLAEVGSLAVDPIYRRCSVEIFVAVTRFMIQYSHYRELDQLLIAVHPRQQRFYESSFGFEPFGPCRSYGFVHGQPAVACRLNMRTVHHTWPRAIYEQFFHPPVPEYRFERPGMRPADHEHFCRMAGILSDYGEDWCDTARCIA